jgi:NTE family protein
MARYDSLSPVEWLPTDRPDEKPEAGLALCLSGGGYRAMLFHLGALWRLNDAGYLPKLARISSVSGGSITAGVLGLAWGRLDFDAEGVGRSFEQEVVQPVRRLAARTIDLGAIVRGILPSKTVGNRVTHGYRLHLFGNHTLRDLPDRPRFVINATNLQSGVLWRFSKPYTWDYRVGKIEQPEIELAVAVAASSAFPPFLSPVVLEFDNSEYSPGSGLDLQQTPYTTKVFLTDGGVYDNLGLETAWKRYSTILVSDGGGKLQPDQEPKRDWLRQAYRVLGVIDNQVRSLRKRQVIASYITDPSRKEHRDGAYWGIRSHIADYDLADALDCPPDKTAKLADVSTRLGRLSTTVQKRLVNWGFAVCDAAMRKHVDPSLSAPHSFPYNDARVG